MKRSEKAPVTMPGPTNRRHLKQRLLADRRGSWPFSVERKLARMHMIAPGMVVIMLSRARRDPLQRGGLAPESLVRGTAPPRHVRNAGRFGRAEPAATRTWFSSRSESMMTDIPGAIMCMRASLRSTQNGKILAIRQQSLFQVGAYFVGPGMVTGAFLAALHAGSL